MGRLITGVGSAVYQKLSKGGRAWDAFWFEPQDPIILGVMRLLVGGMLFYTHLVWGMNLPAFFGDQGWMSRELMDSFQQGEFIFSFWWYVPSNYHFAAHVACLVVLGMFWLGLFTRITSVLALFITISYSYRAQFANYGLDQLNTILTFYLAIGPSGATLSLDRLIQRLWISRNAVRAGIAPVFPVPEAAASARLATRLTQIHFCVIYFYAGISKLQGGAWWNGEAMWLAFSNQEYQSIDMTWLAWYPWMCDITTHVTIIWEVFFVAAIWNRTLRPFWLPIGVIMHFGIGAFMGMWTFGLIMTFGYLAYLEPSTIRSILAGLANGPIFGRLRSSIAGRSLNLLDWQLAFGIADPSVLNYEIDNSTEAIQLQPQFLSAIAFQNAGGETEAAPDLMLRISRKPPLTTTDSELFNDDAVRRSTLPTTKEVRDQPSGNHVPPGKAGRLSVLVLDRSQDRQLETLRHWTSHGFRCVMSFDPLDALEQAREQHPKAIVVIANQLNDAEVLDFHTACKDAEVAASVLYILRPDQRERIGDWLNADYTMVMDKMPSLSGMQIAVEQLLVQTHGPQLVPVMQ